MTFEVTPSAWPKADAILGLPAPELFHRLLLDQESEESFLASRRILHAFLSQRRCRRAHRRARSPPKSRRYAAIWRLAIGAMPKGRLCCGSARRSGWWPAAAGHDLAAGHPARRHRQPPLRAPLRAAGRGRMQHSLARQRRRALAAADVRLPEISAAGFLPRAGPGRSPPCTPASTSRCPGCPPASCPRSSACTTSSTRSASTTCSSARAPLLAEPDLRRDPGRLPGIRPTPGDRGRVAAAARLAIALEREHVALLAELAAGTAPGRWTRQGRRDRGPARPLRGRAARQRTASAAGRSPRPSPTPTSTSPAFLADFRDAAAARRLRRDALPVHAGHQVRRADVRHLRRARGGDLPARGSSRCKPARTGRDRDLAEPRRRRPRPASWRPR